MNDRLQPLKEWVDLVEQWRSRGLIMKRKFFRRVGWFYAPVSLGGFIVTFLAIVFCVTVFITVDRHSHSVSDTLYGVFPFFACAFLLLDWVASRTS